MFSILSVSIGLLSINVFKWFFGANRFNCKAFSLKSLTQMNVTDGEMQRKAHHFHLLFQMWINFPFNVLNRFNGYDDGFVSPYRLIASFNHIPQQQQHSVWEGDRNARSIIYSIHSMKFIHFQHIFRRFRTIFCLHVHSSNLLSLQNGFPIFFWMLSFNMCA